MADEGIVSHLPIDNGHSAMDSDLGRQAEHQDRCQGSEQQVSFVFGEDITMNGIGAYHNTAISTQSKGRLVVLLNEGAIKFLKLAVRELEANNYGAKGQYINRAQDIINELNAVLDMDSGGEISMNLRKLYLFMGRHLRQANAKRDPQMIQEVIDLLEELNQSWKAITG